MKNCIKNFLIPIVAISIAVVMALVYFAFIVPHKNSGDKTITVEIVYEENSFSYDVKTDKETVYELLVETDETYNLQLQCEEGAYGQYITSLKGVKQDDTNGYYYVYTIKGLDFAMGISTQTIKDGDVITFKYVSEVYDENWNLVSQTLKGKGDTDNYVKVGVVFACVCGVLVMLAVALCVVKMVNKNNE